MLATPTPGWTSLFSMARLGQPPNLRRLELYEMSTYSGDGVREIAQLDLPLLEYLEVQDVPAGLGALVEGNWPQLRHLRAHILRMSATDMTALGHAVWDLRTIDLDGVGDGDGGTTIGRQEMAALVAAFPKLTKLVLHWWTNITKEGFIALADGFSHLEFLDIQGAAFSFPDLSAEVEVFTALAAAAWPSLTHFRYMWLSSVAAAALSRATWISRIIKLHIKFTLAPPEVWGGLVDGSMDESGFRAMWSALQGGCLQIFSAHLDGFAPQWAAEDLPRVKLPHLKKFSFSTYRLPGPVHTMLAALCAASATLPCLSDVKFYHSVHRWEEIYLDVPEALVNGAALPRLDRLELCGVIVGEGARGLGRIMRRLSHLGISHAGLGVEDLAEMLEREEGAPSPLFPRLSTLCLSHNHLPDEAGTVLAAASADFPVLESLNLYDNNLGEEGYMELATSAEIRGFPTLKHLTFDELGPSRAAMLALKSAFPGAEMHACTYLSNWIDDSE